MTNTGAEHKEVVKAPSSRRLMRVLTVFATVLAWLSLVSALMDVDFFNGDKLSNRLIEVFIYLWVSQWVVIWTWRAWSQPSGKSDRVVLMASLLILFALPVEVVFQRTPEPWDLPVMIGAWLLIFPGYVWCYRHLERAWTKDNDLLPLADAGDWPADLTFLKAFCCLLLLALALPVMFLEEPPLITAFLPFIGPGLAYLGGKKILARNNARITSTI